MDHNCIQVENVCTAKTQIEELRINQTELFARIGTLEQGSASRSRQLDGIHEDLRDLRDTIHIMQQNEASRMVVIQSIQGSISEFAEQMVETNRSILDLKATDASKTIAIGEIKKELGTLNSSVSEIKSLIDKAHGGIQFFIWFFGIMTTIIAGVVWILKPLFQHIITIK